MEYGAIDLHKKDCLCPSRSAMQVMRILPDRSQRASQSTIRGHLPHERVRW